jgi:signal transduction histidine kinase
MLKQCLINLVKNAMEAMDGGGVLTARTGMDDSSVFLEIRDTGKGIPPDLMDQVFSPFFSTKDKGSGLGLAMVRKAVDDIGGRVELHSRVGEGTRVTLFLPPALAEEGGESPEAPESPEPEGDKEDGYAGEGRS